MSPWALSQFFDYQCLVQRQGFNMSLCLWHSCRLWSCIRFPSSPVMLSKLSSVIASLVIFTILILDQTLMHLIFKFSWNSSTLWVIILYIRSLHIKPSTLAVPRSPIFLCLAYIWPLLTSFPSYGWHQSGSLGHESETYRFRAWTFPIKSNPPNQPSLSRKLPSERWCNWSRFPRESRSLDVALVFAFSRGNLLTSNGLLLSRSRVLQAQATSCMHSGFLSLV